MTDSLRKIKARLGVAKLLMAECDAGRKPDCSAQQLREVLLCASNFAADKGVVKSEEVQAGLLQSIKDVAWHGNHGQQAMEAIANACQACDLQQPRTSGKGGSWTQQDYESFIYYMTEDQWTHLLANAMNIAFCHDTVATVILRLGGSAVTEGTKRVATSLCLMVANQGTDPTLLPVDEKQVMYNIFKRRYKKMARNRRKCELEVEFATLPPTADELRSTCPTFWQRLYGDGRPVFPKLNVARVFELASTIDCRSRRDVGTTATSIVSANSRTPPNMEMCMQMMAAMCQMMSSHSTAGSPPAGQEDLELKFLTPPSKSRRLITAEALAASQEAGLAAPSAPPQATTQPSASAMVAQSEVPEGDEASLARLSGFLTHRDDAKAEAARAKATVARALLRKPAAAMPAAAPVAKVAAAIMRKPAAAKPTTVALPEGCVPCHAVPDIAHLVKNWAVYSKPPRPIYIIAMYVWYKVKAHFKASDSKASFKVSSTSLCNCKRCVAVDTIIVLIQA